MTQFNNKNFQFEWVKASETRFEWVKEFVGE